jgi:hypothetical protein
LEERRLLATLTVTSTADAGAGSLRDAIVMANGNGVADTIEFNIPAADPGFNGTWWTITLASDLPTLTESGTNILGSTQTANQGDTNVGQLGTGGFVGVDNLPLPKYERPEIAINVNGNKSFNMVGTASSIQIEGLAIHGDTGTNSFGGGGGNDALISSNGTGSGRVIGPDAMGNGNAVIVGLLPDGTVPAVKQARFGVRTHSSTTTTVRNSLVAENGRGGIDSVRSSTVMFVYGSEVFNNGWNSVDHDGIDINGINGEVIGNLSYNNVTADLVPRPNAGNGIELGSQDGGTGFNLVENNTSYGNTSSGVGIRSGATGNIVRKNVVYQNRVGISVNDEGITPTNINDLTQNSIFNNTGLGIDLTPLLTGPGGYDGVTLNDQGDLDTGSNDLNNFPIIDSALLSGGNLTVTGFAEPGARIELFVAAPDASGFGEGQTFVASFTEGSANDLDGGTGMYGPMFNGLTVSAAAITTNRFTFVIPAGAVVGGTPLTSTATSPSGSTSEFAPVILAQNSLGIDIEKSTNGQDADLPTGPVLAVGSMATFQYVVTNTGSLPLKNVTVTDDQGVMPLFQGGDTNNNMLLDTTETWIYEASIVVTAGQYANIGTATGQDATNTIPGMVSDNDPSHHFGQLSVLPNDPNELPVNVFVGCVQSTFAETQAVAANANQQIVIAYAGSGTGDGDGVFVRFIDGGVFVGPEMLVNTTTTGNQTFPSAAIGSGGESVVVWSGRGVGDSDGGIFFQLYDNTFAPQGTETRVNVTTSSFQHKPLVSIAPDGTFVVVWSGKGIGDIDSGVFARRYAANGTPLTGELRVNTTSAYYQQEPSIAIANDGTFLITWSGNGPGDMSGIFYQRFDAMANPVGVETLVNTTVVGTQKLPSIGIDDLGTFTIAWSGNGVGDTAGVFLQRFSAAGAPIGGEVRVNTTTIAAQEDASIAVAPDGVAVVTWTSASQDGAIGGVIGQEFDAAGAKFGGEFIINTTTLGDQKHSSVAMAGNTGFVVAWSGRGVGDDSGVFTRRFARNPAIPHNLIAADGQGAGAEAISVAMIAGSVEEAVRRWTASGMVTTAQLAALGSVDYVIADLSPGILAMAGGGRITIDIDAAGHGWFIDATPGDDSEFTVVTAATERTALESSAAFDRIDLLTVLLHEMGHVMGLPHIDLAGHVMSDVLGKGTRRSVVPPPPLQVDRVIASLQLADPVADPIAPVIAKLATTSPVTADSGHKSGSTEGGDATVSSTTVAVDEAIKLLA